MRRLPPRRFRLRVVLPLAALTTLAACGGSTASRPATASPTPDVSTRRLPSSTATDIRVTLVQLNDLYEITPVGGGRWGGPARVATLLQRLEAWNPNTIAVIAGDFFSPSALGTARVDGERLAGRQMVAVLNTMGLDYATFGNHEFDLDEPAFRDRLAESEFEWFSSNVLDAAGERWPGVDDTKLLRFIGSAGDTLRLGLVGVTYGGMPPDYVSVTDPVSAVQRAVDLWGDSVQARVAVTHLPLPDDVALAEAVPELDLIIGGHEHENWMARRGPDLTPIAKADANVRTVYVHDLRWDPSVQKLEIESRLVPITDDLPEDPATAAEVQRWLDTGWAGFREAGFEPEEVVTTVTEALDGLESSVRYRPTVLSDLIARGMLAEVAGADAAMVSGGSIRIDDVVPAGPLTQYDVIRILPFGGSVFEVEMGGALLARVLDQGVANVGSGGYLQTAGVRQDPDSEGWVVGGAPLDPDATYRVAISDFLLTGRETGLDYLTPDHARLTVVAEHRDVRQALIDELRRRYGG